MCYELVSNLLWGIYEVRSIHLSRWLIERCMTAIIKKISQDCFTDVAPWILLKLYAPLAIHGAMQNCRVEFLIAELPLQKLIFADDYLSQFCAQVAVSVADRVSN